MAQRGVGLGDGLSDAVLYIEGYLDDHVITTIDLTAFQSLESLRVHLREQFNPYDTSFPVRIRFKIWDEPFEFEDNQDILDEEAVDLFRMSTWVDVVPGGCPFPENAHTTQLPGYLSKQPHAPSQAEEVQQQQQQPALSKTDATSVSFVGIDALSWLKDFNPQVPKKVTTRIEAAGVCQSGGDGEEASASAVVTFDGIDTLTPKSGRYDVELHRSFLRLQGQADSFKIQYSSVLRIFLLPESNRQHLTYVVVNLASPIRKGQTTNPHVVLQFKTGGALDCNLSLNEEVLNTKCEDRLQPTTYKGIVHEDFTTILRGLSGAKVTRPGKFRSCQDGYAVKSSLKAEDGFLYPLEMGFIFLTTSPTLVFDDEVEYVKFVSVGGTEIHYLDLLVKLKNEQEHLFRNIQRNEYDNLFDFISGKGLKIMNLGDIGVAAVLPNNDDDAVYPHLGRIRNDAGGDESDQEKSNPGMALTDMGRALGKRRKK